MKAAAGVDLMREKRRTVSVKVYELQMYSLEVFIYVNASIFVWFVYIINAKTNVSQSSCVCCLIELICVSLQILRRHHKLDPLCFSCLSINSYMPFLINNISF